MTHLIGKLVSKSNNKKFVKIKYNQLLILDALMIDGGYIKKYEDKQHNYRYSEHSGNFDFVNDSFERIIVSVNTSREDNDDGDILLPNNLYDTYEYKYFFHTHPPTPYPGGRAKDGILYEFPSISDIFHFIDHYNSGTTLGSIVVAPEGYYLIFPKKFSIKKIKYDLNIETEMIKHMEIENSIIQDKAILKYGTDFDEEYYLSTIAHDNTFLKMYEQMLNKYLDSQIKIVLKQRVKHKMTNKWIVKHLYLPI